MKKVIKLTENDISNLITETLNEIGWQTPNALYDKHADGARYLERFASDLSEFVGKWSDKYGGEREVNSINSIKDPIKGKVLGFINQAREMIGWCERKSEQIKNFKHSSEDRFKEQNGMSMSDYADAYSDEDNSLFDKYAGGEMSDDEYDSARRDLKDRYADIDDITRY